MKIIKTIAYNTKRRRPRFRKNQKLFFLSIRYRKTSQTQDVKSQSTERSVRKIAQPKRDSAFEQKTRIVSCGEISASSQNSFFIYNQRIKPTRAQKRHLWNLLNVVLAVSVFPSVKSPKIFRKVWTKIIKTIAHNTKRRRPRFRKKGKAVFVNIRYRKTSQTQDSKSQSTERRVRKIAHPKRDSAFEQKTRIVSCGEISANSQNSFFIYNQRIKPTRARKDLFGTYSTSLQNFCFCLAQEKRAVFISIRYHKTSQTQDVKSQSTNPTLRKLAQPKRDSAFEQKTPIVPSTEIWGSSQNNFL